MTFNQMVLIISNLVLKNKGKPITTILTKYDNVYDNCIITGEIKISESKISESKLSIYIICHTKGKNYRRSFSIDLRSNEIYYWLSTYGRWELLKVPENILEDIV